MLRVCVYLCVCVCLFEYRCFRLLNEEFKLFVSVTTELMKLSYRYISCWVLFFSGIKNRPTLGYHLLSFFLIYFFRFFSTHKTFQQQKKKIKHTSCFVQFSKTKRWRRRREYQISLFSDNQRSCLTYQLYYHFCRVSHKQGFLQDFCD